MNKVVVSVIVPIYNVGQFIDRGIKNLLSQTFLDFEIILVDDGSTDDSYERCLAWSKKDSRVRVLRQLNQGAGGARNTGIDNAKGEYIYFYDIDDEISNELLKHNVRIMESMNVDFILFGYKSKDIKYGIETIVSFSDEIIKSNAELKNRFVDLFVLNMNGFPWNKFYRKSFLNEYGIRYENQRIQQDEVFNLKVYQRLEKAFISSEILYKNYIYSKGNTRSRFISDRFDIYKSVRQHFEELRQFWKLNDKRFDDYLQYRFYQSVMTCMLFNLTHPQSTFSKQQAKDEIERIMDDPLTKESFEYADKTIKGVEHRLYRRACRKRNLWQIKFLVSLFCYLRKIKETIKGFSF